MREQQDWFLNSPIGMADGRYLAHYKNSSRGPVYPEITAYAISLACIWHRRTGDARYLERARRGAEYLLQVSRPGVRGPDDDRIYTFDTAIFATGLLDLFAISAEQSHLVEATRRLDWLLERTSGGSPVATVPEERAPEQLRAWPLRGSVHLAKIALPLLKGWRATKREAYLGGARRVLGWALELQSSDGRFRIDAARSATMTHPHCYAEEALVYGAWALQDAELHAAADRAADWLAAAQNDDGSFYKWYGRRGLLRTKVSDATAQALRIWRIQGRHERPATRAAAYLRSVAMSDGGLPNHVRTLGPLHWRERRVYAWPTFFWQHALSIEFGNAAAAEELF